MSITRFQYRLARLKAGDTSMRRAIVGAVCATLLTGCVTGVPRTQALATDAITVEHASPPAKAAAGRSWRWFFEKCDPEGGECHTDWKGAAKVGGIIAAMCVLFWPRDHMQNPNTRNQGADAATTP